jgi:hypothetical protein
MLTKTDIAALRKANDLTVHLSSKTPQGLVRAIKRKRTSEQDPFAQDVEHIVTAKVELHDFRGQEQLKNGSAQFFAMCGIYHGQVTHVSSVIKTLRAGDEITFRFWPDAHTNGYVAMSSLHADVLYLDVRRNGKRVASWELDVSICPSNSARMCRGIPNSEHYERDGQEARRVA